MTRLATRDFTREPSAFIDRVARGERFELTRYGKVVALLIPVENVAALDSPEAAALVRKDLDQLTGRPVDAVGPPRDSGRGKVSASSYADRHPGQVARDAILGAARGRKQENR